MKSKNKSSRGGKARSLNGDGFSCCKQPIPDSVGVTLRYSDSQDVTASVGAYSWQFRGNGPYDPDVTYTGVQPPCFDQWAALYDRYTVVSSTITVRAISRAVSNCMRIAVGPATSGGAQAFDAIAGQRYAVSKDTTGGAQAAVLSLDLMTATVGGVTKASVLDSASAGWDSAVSSTPAKQWFWNVAVETSGSSDALSLYVVVTYRVKFWQPAVQTVSLMTRPTGSPSQRRSAGATCTAHGVTATAEEEKPTDSLRARGGLPLSDPVIHVACPCDNCRRAPA